MNVLLVAGMTLVVLLVAVAVGRARRTRDDCVLPARSELSTLAFPPTTQALRHPGVQARATGSLRPHR